MLTGTLALLEPLPPGPEHVAVLTEISDEHMLLGQYETGLEVADRALALAAELGLGRPARTLGFRATSRSYLDERGALDDFEEALELALEAGQGRHAAVIYNNWAIARGSFEGPAQGLETFNLGVAFCRARGISSWENWMRRGTANPLFRLGQLDQYLAVIAGAAERARLESSAYWLAQTRLQEARVRLLRGQAGRMASVPDELEAGIGDATHRAELSVRIGVAAWIRAALGQSEQAIALLTRFADERFGTMYETVQAALDVGEIELAGRIAERANRDLGPLPAAAIAEGRGDLGPAVDCYAQAVDYFRNRGEVVYLARALVGLGRVLARSGRTAEAVEALDEARPILVRLEAAPLLAETDALLRQLTALSA
jgi:tetratricopeptide (TPR) repeat protein